MTSRLLLIPVVVGLLAGCASGGQGEPADQQPAVTVIVIEHDAPEPPPWASTEDCPAILEWC